MSLSDLAPLERGADDVEDVVSPRLQRLGVRRFAAGVIDAAIVLTPLAVGALVLRSLLGVSGVGSADLVTFGGAAVLVSAALHVWSVGLGRGRGGASVGDRACGLVVRSRDGRPLGLLGGLDPFSAREILSRGEAESLGFSARPPAFTRGQRLGMLAALGVLLAFLLLASLAVGSRSLSISDVIGAIVPPYDGAVRDADLIVRELRLPRTLLAIVVGAALGAAGATIQGHTRNPLADPSLLGVSAGAACAVVLAIYTLGVSTPLQYVWFAFAGALVASAAVFALSTVGNGARSPLTLVLAGSAFAAVLGSITSAVVLIDETTLDSYRFWVVGSLAGRDLDVLLPLLPFIGVGLLLALAGAPGLNLLATGTDVATSLGLDTRTHRVIGVVAITLLTGAATAACGPIAFIGLVAPHVARAVVGSDYRWVVPTSALAGAALLLAGDVVGRVLVRPAELQVGIVVALVGAPFLIMLVRRRTPASL